jgi:spore germination cell wall hydrolase CwlJ-like protein|tara:strand:+ start:898 stop:1506 length:609 start_codon:yes stop_codon:yes gene_type:complete
MWHAHKGESMIAVTDHEVNFSYSGWIIKIISLVCVMSGVFAVTSWKLDMLSFGKDTFRYEFASAGDRTNQLECLTRNIYYEAATEPFEGKVAVAQVTLNRVASGNFANTVCGVVYEKNVVYQKVICQFSWFCDGKSATKPIHAAAWKESNEVAKKVLLENFRLPSMVTAMYYHADYVNPKWGKPKIAKIGKHIFYSEKPQKI